MAMDKPGLAPDHQLCSSAPADRGPGWAQVRTVALAAYGRWVQEPEEDPRCYSSNLHGIGEGPGAEAHDPHPGPILGAS